MYINYHIKVGITSETLHKNHLNLFGHDGRATGKEPNNIRFCDPIDRLMGMLNSVQPCSSVKSCKACMAIFTGIWMHLGDVWKKHRQIYELDCYIFSLKTKTMM